MKRFYIQGSDFLYHNGCHAHPELLVILQIKFVSDINLYSSHP